MASYDLVILGAGSGGYAAALRGSQLGLKVALIERDVLGGTCLHRGCIPTKALLHAGEIADNVRESASFGVKSNLLGIDMPEVNKYKDGVVGRLYKGLQGLVKHRGVDYVTGEGKFVGPNKVKVGDQEFVGNYIVLATGSFPKSLPSLEIDGTQVINSEHALKLDKVPASVIILGGGVIGVEFASVWKSLGAEVTIIEGLPRLVPAEDEAVSKAMERAFKKRGINFSTGVRFAGVDRTKHGVVAKLEDGQTFAADLMLVAVGRGSATRNQGFEEAGLEFDGELLKVNENLQTNLANVYAVGDIVRGPQLAHKGFQEGIFVAEHMKGLNPRIIDITAIPRVTYSEPEIASVGLNEPAAKEKYGVDQIRTIQYDLAGNGKSQILKTAGFIKLIALKNGGQIVGIHMIGSRVGELLAEAQLMYSWDASPEDVAPYVHAHPTMSEAMGEAAMALAGKPLHTHS
ncbi:MAG: dihydrolipoyl dehydrogenase [Candidatus Nanopelagicales bacterium]|nr:dihydrolipoyl dehydrogenase [Candidatus Nanopelagicales bacterium]MDP5107831.1 dihydrolipoyl dehydrogenase [Candidatus Nanopelagicales bacterium]